MRWRPISKLYLSLGARSFTDLDSKMQSPPPQDSPSVIPIGAQQGANGDTDSKGAPNIGARANGREKRETAVVPGKTTSSVPDNMPALVNDALSLIVYLTGSGDNP